MVHTSVARVLVVAMCALVGVAMTGGAAANPTLTKPQYISRGDATCAGAIAQIAKLAPLYPAARTAAIGNRWLAIDRRTLTALRALAPPPADRATATKLLSLAAVTINTGLANLVSAARSGSSAKYAAAGARFGAMIRKAHAAASAYGFSACSRW